MRKVTPEIGLTVNEGMTMKKFFFTILTVAAALCGCTKDELLTNEVPSAGEDERNETLTFTAVMEGTLNTRVTLADMTPSWQIGDQIRINKSYIYEAQNAGTTATFWATDQQASGSSYEALFPTSYMVQWGYGNPQMHFPPDEEYPWVDGGFTMPMYAKSDNTELHFKNLCGVLRITVPEHQISQVKRIRVYNTVKPMFGLFEVGSDGGLVLTNPNPNPAEGERMRSVIFSNAVPVRDESKVFYIALAPQEYGRLRIDISEDGETFPYQLSTKYFVTIERNKIYNVAFTDPRSTEYITVVPAEYDDKDFE